MQYIKLVDINDKRLEPYFSLSETQLYHYFEPEAGVFIAESAKVIKRSLDAGYEPVGFLVEQEIIEDNDKSASDAEICAILSEYPNTVIYAIPRDIMSRVPGYAVTRGLLCCLRRKAMPTMEELCNNRNRIVVLESVDNPTNVGAIFRSAAALFMDALLLTPDCADPLYRRAARVSMGTVFQIPYTYIESDSPMHYVDRLHELGYKVAAMALSDNSISIDDARLKECEKLVVLMGSEGDGLSAKTIEKADYVVKIPMAEGIDSLNVSAAAAVAFFGVRPR
ncbi:MAG: RNA methyltransferase [Lachnospiraceae bacterium]|nr:RNA methyltransferase [Lachnospiraceae bacterium]